MTGGMTVVETERLRLRAWRADDVDELAAVFAEPAFWRYPFGRGLTRDETEQFLAREVAHWEAHGYGRWAVERRDEPGIIGYAGLAIPTWLPEVLPAVEVGWRLHPDHWGRGLATEAGRASLRHGFEDLGLDRIISIFVRENVASGRVMEKLGMRPCLTTSDPTTGDPLEVTEITAADWVAFEGRRRREPG